MPQRLSKLGRFATTLATTFGRFDPLSDPHKLVKNLGPVVWIRSHFLVVFSLKLDVPGISGRRVVKVRCLRV
jgi:hypothetical protein